MFMPLIKLNIRCVCTVTFSFLYFFSLRILRAGPLCQPGERLVSIRKLKYLLEVYNVQLVENQQYLRTEIGSMLWVFFQFGGVGGNFHFFKFAIKISAIKTCIFLFCNVIMIPDQKMSETSAATGNGSKSICLFFKNIIDCVYLYSSQRLL